MKQKGKEDTINDSPSSHKALWVIWTQWKATATICTSQRDTWSLLPAGVSLNPIIVYCSSQEEMDLWFGLLEENIEANGGTAIAPENFTRVKVGLLHNDTEIHPCLLTTTSGNRLQSLAAIYVVSVGVGSPDVGYKTAPLPNIKRQTHFCRRQTVSHQRTPACVCGCPLI